jgi:hypothetical protein
MRATNEGCQELHDFSAQAFWNSYLRSFSPAVPPSWLTPHSLTLAITESRFKVCLCICTIFGIQESPARVTVWELAHDAALSVMPSHGTFFLFIPYNSRW